MSRQSARVDFSMGQWRLSEGAALNEIITGSEAEDREFTFYLETARDQQEMSSDLVYTPHASASHSG